MVRVDKHVQLLYCAAYMYGGTTINVCIVASLHFEWDGRASKAQYSPKFWLSRQQQSLPAT